MKKFKELYEKVSKKASVNVGGPSADFVYGDQDDDEEATTYKPRAQGEVEYSNQHTVTKKDHPVAPNDQFTGGTKHAGDHKGHDGEPGERQVVKSKGISFKELRATKSSKRKQDKDQKDPMKKVKEDIDYEESIELTEVAHKDPTVKKIMDISKSKRQGSVVFKNKETMTVDPKDAMKIMKVIPKLNQRNRNDYTSKLSKDAAGFMQGLDFANRMRG